MSKNSQLSQPAKAGNGIVNEQNFDGKQYSVVEIPVNSIGRNSIRMDPEELRRFAKETDLPLFNLKVEEMIYNGIPTPVKNPYEKVFTVFQNIFFFSEEFCKEVKQ